MTNIELAVLTIFCLWALLEGVIIHVQGKEIKLLRKDFDLDKVKGSFFVQQKKINNGTKKKPKKKR